MLLSAEGKKDVVLEGQLAASCSGVYCRRLKNTQIDCSPPSQVWSGLIFEVCGASIVAVSSTPSLHLSRLPHALHFNFLRLPRLPRNYQRRLQSPRSVGNSACSECIRRRGFQHCYFLRVRTRLYSCRLRRALGLGERRVGKAGSRRGHHLRGYADTSASRDRSADLESRIGCASAESPSVSVHQSFSFGRCNLARLLLCPVIAHCTFGSRSCLSHRTFRT